MDNLLQRTKRNFSKGIKNLAPNLATKNIALLQVVFLAWVAVFLFSCSANTFKTAVEGIDAKEKGSSPPADIRFTNDVEQGPVQSDTVAIEVNLANANPTDFYYVLISAADTCEASSFVGVGVTKTQFDQNPIIFNDESKNDKYLCATAKNTAATKEVFVKSAYPFNIDVTKPTVVFATGKNVLAGPVQSNEIVLKATDTHLDTNSLQYGFSADATCDNNDTFTESFEHNVAFTINKEDFNNKYLCAKASDTAGNIGYSSASAYPLKIDITKPLITFVLAVAQGPVGSQKIKIGITDTNKQDATYAYRYAAVDANTNCADGDYTNGSQTFQDAVEFSVTSALNTKYICARAKDKAGNTSYLKSEYPVNIDNNTPSIDFGGIPVTWATTVSPTITVTGTGLTPASYRYVLVNSASACNASAFPTSTTGTTFTSGNSIGTYNTEAAAINTKYICAKASNNLNNTAYVASGQVKIDRTDPTISITDVSTAWVQSDDVVISVNESHPKTGTYQYALVDAATNCNNAVTFSTAFTSGSAITFSTESQSGKYICAKAQDQAGNIAYQKSANPLKIDRTVPTISITGVSTAWVQSDDVTISVSDSHLNATNHASYQYALVNAATTCNSSVTFSTAFTSGSAITFSTESQSGEYICAKAQDQAGNIAYEKSSNPLKIDTTLPTITITGVSTAWVQSDDITISVSDSHLNATNHASYQYALVNAATTCNNSVTFSTAFTSGSAITFSTESQSGKHICAKAQDQAGNIAYQKSSNPLKIDRTVPTISITGVSTTWVQSDDVTISVSDSHLNATNHASYQYALVNAATTCNNSSVTFSTAFTSGSAITFSTESQSGKYICAKAQDQAGNIAYQKSSNPLKIDRTVPTITITGVSTAWVQSDDVTISVSDTNANTASHASYQYALVNAATTCNNSVTFSTAFTSGSAITFSTESQSGKHICAKAQDQAGNIAYQKSINPLKIDTTLPTITITGVSTTWVQSDDVTISVSDSHLNATNHASYQYALVNAATTCNNSSVTFSTAFTSGSAITFSTESQSGKYICAKAQDQAGNIAYQKSTDPLKIDTTPPDLSFTQDIASTTAVASQSIQIAVTETNPQTNTYQYAFVNTATSCGNSTTFPSANTFVAGTAFTIAVDTHNTKYICAKAADQAGNIGYKVTSNPLNVVPPTLVFRDDVSATAVQSDAIQVEIQFSNFRADTFAYGFSSSNTNCSSVVTWTTITGNGPIFNFTINTNTNNGKYVCAKGQKTDNSWVYKSSANTLNIDNVAPTIVSAETIDSDNNGKIDGYKIVFSEKVKDSSFPGYNGGSPTATTEWLVKDHANVKLNTNVSGDVTDDEVIYITFDEKSGACNFLDQTGCDTGSKPDITTKSTSANATLTDIAGNPLAKLNSITVAEADRAKPVVLTASSLAYPDSNLSVKVMFSENVSADSAECDTATSCAALYSISPSLSVTKAVLENGTNNDNAVILTTAQQTKDTSYTLTVAANKVKDVNNNTVNGSKKTFTFKGAPPALVLLSAQAINNTKVKIIFNENVTNSALATTATIAKTKYAIGGLQVLKAERGSNNSTIVLTTSSQTSDSPHAYKVTVISGKVVSAVDNSRKCNQPNNKSSFTGDRLPEVTAVTSVNANTIYVRFSENVKAGTGANGALNSANYGISPSLSLSNPQWATAGDHTVVKLTTGAQNTGTIYTLTVSNVHDTTANNMHSTLNKGKFLGREAIKMVSAHSVATGSNSYALFKVVFSKPFKHDGSNHAVDKTSGGSLVNWDFPFPTGSSVAICTNTADPEDDACPNSYSSDATELFFKVSPKPPIGAYTVVAATAVGKPTGALGCIQSATDTNCLKGNPDDRAAVIWTLPKIVQEGPVYTDPFNDNVTFSGQVLQYNGKLLVGPNDTDTGVFMTDLNLTNARSIVLDSNMPCSNVNNCPAVAGIQPFQNLKAKSANTELIGGIDYMYAACYKAGGAIDSTLSGVACTAAGGTEYLYIVAFNKSGGGYSSIWWTTDKVSPFSFKQIANLGGTVSTVRAMAVRQFKNFIYVVSPTVGNYTTAPITNAFTPGANRIPSGQNLQWELIPEISYASTGSQDKNGLGDHGSAANTLLSLDTLHEHNNQLYIGNGGWCDNCLSTPQRSGTTYYDGGIARNNASNNSGSGTDPLEADGSTYWDVITPTDNTIWTRFMSKALPGNPDTTSDWNHLVPKNTIAPSIKAIPKMVSFKGSLYVIRNACASNTITPLSATVGDTCPAGKERPQLWRLPDSSCTSSTSASACRTAWQFIGNTTSTNPDIKYTTRMGGAQWKDGNDQVGKTAKNKYITLLEVVGDRLYVGFDNEEGVNAWRTKEGVTTPTSEADFEAICETGNSCFQPEKQFGLVSSSVATDVKMFDSISVNDAGEDYLIFNSRSGNKPLRIYRQNNK